MGFENLDIWKRSARLSVDLYRELKDLKDYGFKDQITRSGLSIPSNIAEGEEGASLKECLNFLNYAKGSCGELKTQVYIGMEIKYIPRELGQRWLKETSAISSLLGGLVKSKRKLLPENKRP